MNNQQNNQNRVQQPPRPQQSEPPKINPDILAELRSKVSSLEAQLQEEQKIARTSQANHSKSLEELDALKTRHISTGIEKPTDFHETVGEVVSGMMRGNMSTQDAKALLRQWLHQNPEFDREAAQDALRRMTGAVDTVAQEVPRMM